jgi:hypothetical protein
VVLQIIIAFPLSWVPLKKPENFKDGVMLGASRFSLPKRSQLFGGQPAFADELKRRCHRIRCMTDIFAETPSSG